MSALEDRSLAPIPASTMMAHVPTTTNDGSFLFPHYSTYPPLYTLQRNLESRASQLALWSDLVISYCAYYRIFRISVSSPPADLFSITTPPRRLSPGDVRIVLEHMSRPENGSRIDWIPATKGEQSSSCYVYWKTIEEWANAIYEWVEDTGQKGMVLTLYELREGEGMSKQDWAALEDDMLRKVIGALAKKGKAQMFGHDDGIGVKFF